MSVTTEPVSLKITAQPTTEERKLNLDSDVTTEQIASFSDRLDGELQMGLQQVLAPDHSWTKVAMLGYIQAVTEAQNKLFDIEGDFAHRQVIRGLNDPDQALDQLVELLPIAMFFLLPAYAALLKIFYLRRKKYFVEHLVFALHLHTFALRRFYQQSRAKTWVKYVLLINAYGILTVPAMILVMATTFAAY